MSHEHVLAVGFFNRGLLLHAYVEDKSFLSERRRSRIMRHRFYPFYRIGIFISEKTRR